MQKQALSKKKKDSLNTLQGKRHKRLSQRESLWGYLLITPLMAGWIVFFLIGLFASLGISFTQWNLLTAPSWVALDNYARLLKDPLFFETLKNTLFLALLYVPLSTVVSLSLALALNREIQFRAFYRTVYFLPVLTMPVASATIWQWLYNPSFGPVNYFLSTFGLPSPAWLSDQNTAMIAVVIVLVWNIAGYNMVLFLSGLQNIPKEYYEAAEIDGAGAWPSFRYVTLPLVAPTTFFVVTTTLILAFQVFDVIYVMTQGGPADSTRTLVYYIYEEAFQFLRMGYASAMSWILFLIILIFTLFQFRLQRYWVHYQ